MNTLDLQLVRLSHQAVLGFIARREQLRGFINSLGLHHPFVRQVYAAMPPVAPCLDLALRARAHAASIMLPAPKS